MILPMTDASFASLVSFLVLFCLSAGRVLAKMPIGMKVSDFFFINTVVLMKLPGSSLC